MLYEVITDIEDVGVEVVGGRPAVSSRDDPHGRLVIEGGLVRSPAPQGVVLVDEVQDPPLDGDLLASESLGIPLAVPPLVVVQGELLGGAEEGTVRTAENPRAA